jgi:hypothetical protein
MTTLNKNFKLGLTVATPGAIRAAEKIGITLGELIVKHKNLEQGDLCDEDYQQNIDSVANEGKKDIDGYPLQNRIFSSYIVKDVKFWVITEADRSATTVLLPNEY